MDKMDLKILNELTKDAQLPFSKIAGRLGVSTKTVQSRYEKMKKEGVILRSSITIDLSKLGFQGRAFLMITNTPDQTREETMDALKRLENVFLIAEVIGDFDVLAIAAAKDLESMISIVNEIRGLQSVEQVEFTLTGDVPFPIERGFEQLFQAGKQEPGD
jgi:Lrp/AsnC family transcriptional regulator for asnA, asnC and gidA